MELTPQLLSAADTLRKIEAWRDRRLNDTSPLISGGLQEGIFDKDVTVADACKVSKKKINAEQLFLFSLLSQGGSALEIGTNVGVSGAYIAAALSMTGRTSELHTIESSPYRIQLAKEMHTALKLDQRQISPRAVLRQNPSSVIRFNASVKYGVH